MSIKNEKYYTEITPNGTVIYSNEKTNAKLYASASANEYDKTDFICDFCEKAEIKKEEEEKLYKKSGERIYYHIQTAAGEHSVTAARQITVDGMDNLRDLGGYLTENGRQVKWGVFFRSGALGYANGESAQRQLEKLRIKTVLDLRSAAEIAELADIPLDGAQYTAKSALVTMDNGDVNFDLSRICAEGAVALTEAQAFVNAGYLLMPFDNPAYKFMFDALLKEKTPILFHCTAGKDRTGIAAALILTALGVPYETVCEDYMLTNALRQKTAERMQKKYGGLLAAADSQLDAAQIFRLIAGVQAENLKAAFDAIYKKYSTFKDYLSAQYGIGAAEIKKLEQLYLV